MKLEELMELLSYHSKYDIPINFKSLLNTIKNMSFKFKIDRDIKTIFIKNAHGKFGIEYWVYDEETIIPVAMYEQIEIGDLVIFKKNADIYYEQPEK